MTPNSSLSYQPYIAGGEDGRDTDSDIASQQLQNWNDDGSANDTRDVPGIQSWYEQRRDTDMLVVPANTNRGDHCDDTENTDASVIQTGTKVMMTPRRLLCQYL